MFTQAKQVYLHMVVTSPVLCKSPVCLLVEAGSSEAEKL